MKILKIQKHGCIDIHSQGLFDGCWIEDYRNYWWVIYQMNAIANKVVQYSAISLRYHSNHQIIQSDRGIDVDRITHCGVFGSIHWRGNLSCFPQYIVWYLSPKGQEDVRENARYNFEKNKDLNTIRSKLKTNQREITGVRHRASNYRKWDRRNWQSRRDHCLCYHIRISINGNFRYLWNLMEGWRERHQRHQICIARFLSYSMTRRIKEV